VDVWKNLGMAVHDSWNALSAGKNMSGYNAFISENFDSMKANLALMISVPLDENPPAGFTASTGASAGEIVCSFQEPAQKGKEITLFAQKRASGNGKTEITRYEQAGAVSPLTLSGLVPDAEYHVYAVLTDGPYEAAKTVSASVAAMAKAGAEAAK
jgi:hypothetical protein